MNPKNGPPLLLGLLDPTSSIVSPLRISQRSGPCARHSSSSSGWTPRVRRLHEKLFCRGFGRSAVPMQLACSHYNSTREQGYTNLCLFIVFHFSTIFITFTISVNSAVSVTFTVSVTTDDFCSVAFVLSVTVNLLKYFSSVSIPSFTVFFTLRRVPMQFDS